MTEPTDSLRALYEDRAAQQYAEPQRLPNPRVDRRFGRICELVRAQLPAEAFLDAARAVAELYRVLRPGGALVLSTENEGNHVTRVLNAPRMAAVRAFRLRGARGRIASPATPYTRESFRAPIERGGFAVEHLETFRLHPMWPFDFRPLTRALNVVDAHLPPHGLGDIVVAVARR